MKQQHSNQQHRISTVRSSASGQQRLKQQKEKLQLRFASKEAALKKKLQKQEQEPEQQTGQEPEQQTTQEPEQQTGQEPEQQAVPEPE